MDGIESFPRPTELYVEVVDPLLGVTWAMQKNLEVIYRFLRGWNPTQLYGDYVINNEINKDPY